MPTMAELPWMWDWSPEAWTAIAAWATAGVAAAAAVGATVLARRQVDYAHKQVEEARTTRENQAQPFVSVDFERSRASDIFMDFVIRNSGPTLARNVRFIFDMPLRSTLDDRKTPLRDAAILNKGIPTLPPGREYRMLFERMPDLYDDSELPRTYEVTVYFDDMEDRAHKLTYRLDLDIFYDHEQLRIFGEHDAAEALMDVSKRLKDWTSRNNGVRVWSRDEERQDDRDRADIEEWKRERREARGRQDQSPDDLER